MAEDGFQALGSVITDAQTAPGFTQDECYWRGWPDHNVIYWRPVPCEWLNIKCATVAVDGAARREAWGSTNPWAASPKMAAAAVVGCNAPTSPPKDRHQREHSTLVGCGAWEVGLGGKRRHARTRPSPPAHRRLSANLNCSANSASSRMPWYCSHRTVSSVPFSRLVY